MHLVGSYTYCGMMHGAYNVKYTIAIATMRSHFLQIRCMLHLMHVATVIKLNLNSCHTYHYMNEPYGHLYIEIQTTEQPTLLRLTTYINTLPPINLTVFISN